MDSRLWSIYRKRKGMRFWEIFNLRILRNYTNLFCYDWRIDADKPSSCCACCIGGRFLRNDEMHGMKNSQNLHRIEAKFWWIYLIWTICRTAGFYHSKSKKNIYKYSSQRRGRRKNDLKCEIYENFIIKFSLRQTVDINSNISLLNGSSQFSKYHSQYSTIYTIVYQRIYSVPEVKIVPFASTRWISILKY